MNSSPMTASMSAHCTAPYDPVSNFSFNNRSVCATRCCQLVLHFSHAERMKGSDIIFDPRFAIKKRKKTVKKKGLQKQHLVVEYKLNTCVSSEMNPFMVFRSDHFQFF